MAAGQPDVDLFGVRERPKPEAVLKQTFIFPPFTILNAREGDWQERKRAWLLIGIRSELGRGGLGSSMTNASTNAMELAGGFKAVHGAAPGGSARPALGKYEKDRRGDAVGQDRGADGSVIKFATVGRPMQGAGLPCQTGSDLDGYRNKEKADAAASGLTFGGFSSEFGARGASPEASGTSVFDPVLCELLYRWFSPADGLVLDPFAGGSVRGIVASALGRRYTGIELRAEQVDENRTQADIGGGPLPEWITGDSRNATALVPPGFRADLVFSCPPYADLERYSNDPLDLSTLDYPAFVVAYREIIAACVKLMADDSFACFVVGDVRGKDGNYYGLPLDTINAFRDAGCALYNEAILVTSVGSLPVRVTSQFVASRKLGKTHQNILVFIKGNAKRAAAKCEKLGR
ncbi:MAG TPA: DNA methyltransferase, partial [Thermohalobaculum sp.]|nr:DNA methyltransferase [Thermohalobaculum sp.]